MFKSPIICALALIIGLTACNNAQTDGSEINLSESTKLSFHMVRDESNNEAAMRLALEGKVPPGAIYLNDREGSGLIVERRTQINQDCLEKVSHSKHPTTRDGYVLNFKFDVDCAKRFGEVTSKNIGKRFAVVLNDKILTAPKINGAITGGSGFIEGDFTQTDVENLVSDLRQTIKMNKPKK